MVNPLIAHPIEVLGEPLLCPEFNPFFAEQDWSVWRAWCELMRTYAPDCVPDAVLLYRTPRAPGALWPIMHYSNVFDGQDALWSYQHGNAILEVSGGCLPCEHHLLPDLLAALSDDLALEYRLPNVVLPTAYVEDDRALWVGRLGADLTGGYGQYLSRLSSRQRYDLVTRPGGRFAVEVPVHPSLLVAELAVFAVNQCRTHWPSHLEQQFAIWQALWGVAAAAHHGACLVTARCPARNTLHGFAVAVREVNADGHCDRRMITTCCTDRTPFVGSALVQGLIQDAATSGFAWFDLALLTSLASQTYAQYLRRHATGTRLAPTYLTFAEEQIGLAEARPPYYKAGAWHT